MKWFTKGEVFTSCFKKVRNKCVQKALALSKNVPPLVNDNEQGPSGGGWGGGRERFITFLLRGRIIFFYYANRSLTVSLLSELFT